MLYKIFHLLNKTSFDCFKKDWGATPAAIDNCLSIADKYDVQVNIHTDTLNEGGFVES